MRTSRTSTRLIEKAIQERWIKQLAFYHMLKLRFSNSCIYDYKSRMAEVAAEFNISTKTLYTYVAILRSKDMVFDRDNNLILRSIRDFGTKRNVARILATNKNSLKEIKCMLDAKILEQQAKKQAYMEGLRRFEKGDQFKDRLGENSYSPSMSYRTIAKVLHCSEKKAFDVVMTLNKLEIIKSTKQKPILISRTAGGLEHYSENLPGGYRYSIGSHLYEQYGCRQTFLQFPIRLKKMSIKEYKRLDKRHL